MNITVEFNAGTSIEQACQEAKDFAIKMNFEWVMFKFNGISMSISQQCNVEKACNSFLKVLSPEKVFKFVVE